MDRAVQKPAHGQPFETTVGEWVLHDSWHRGTDLLARLHAIVPSRLLNARILELVGQKKSVRDGAATIRVRGCVATLRPSRQDHQRAAALVQVNCWSFES